MILNGGPDVYRTLVQYEWRPPVGGKVHVQSRVAHLVPTAFIYLSGKEVSRMLHLRAAIRISSLVGHNFASLAGFPRPQRLGDDRHIQDVPYVDFLQNDLFLKQE